MFKKIFYLLLLLFELTLLTILAAMVEVKEIVARNCQTLKDDLLFLGGISGHFGSFSYPIGIYFTFLSKKLWTIDGSSNTIQSHFIFFDLTVPIHHVLLLYLLLWLMWLWIFLSIHYYVCVLTYLLRLGKSKNIFFKIPELSGVVPWPKSNSVEKLEFLFKKVWNFSNYERMQRLKKFENLRI